jgi:hypothetical protein
MVVARFDLVYLRSDPVHAANQIPAVGKNDTLMNVAAMACHVGIG